MCYIHTVHTFIHTTYTLIQSRICATYIQYIHSYIHILHTHTTYTYYINLEAVITCILFIYIQYIHKFTTRFTIIYLNQYIHTYIHTYYSHETFLPNIIFFAFPLLYLLEKKQGSGLHSKGCRREGRVRIDKGAAGESGERLEWKKLCIRSLRWACQS